MRIGLGLSIPELATRGGKFSPASLFAGGAQGVWYAPDDFSTLFQDSAGTTPVTAVEQPVGLMLDKSQGLVLGSELVTNGDFSNGLTGWTNASTGTSSATVVNNAAVLVGTDNSNQARIRQTSLVTAGKSYRVTFNVTVTSGTLVFEVGSSFRLFTASGSYSYIESTTANGDVIVRTPSGGGNFTIDNISVRELAGNHASQSTAASRPVLRARYNLLTYSEQFDNAAWTKGGGSTVTANSVTAPDGTTTADTLVLTTGSATSQLYQSVAITNGPVTVSVWLRADAPVTLDFGFYDSASDVGSINVTTEWQRFTRTRAGGLTGADRRACWLYKGSAGGTTVYVWGAQLVTGSSAGTYQRIAAATDYATAGFLPYLDFITDDSLSTGSIDFTATDKMFVCAGVTKNSDAATAILVELSASADTNNGAFYIAAPAPGGAANYTAVVRGNTTTNGYALTTFAAPRTNTLAVVFDISGTTTATEIPTSNVNGAVPTRTAVGGGSDSGTGNFGNYPLYIGRRGNTSYPLNGRLYQKIVVGKAPTAAELASTEAFVNSKTGAY